MDRQIGDREVPATEQIFRSITDLGKSDDGEMMGGVARSREDILIDLMGERVLQELRERYKAVNRSLDLEKGNLDLRNKISRWELSALRAGEGAARISHERARQQVEEGYGVDHDSRHGPSDLTHAAVAYALLDSSKWPWGNAFNPAQDRVRNLEKAGALIAAEIDRILHARRKKSEAPDFDARAPQVNIQERPFA